MLKNLSSWEQEKDDACSSFLTGLQWNISCYHGVKSLSNWAYMWSFAPTISQLSEFLDMDKVTKIQGHIDFEREQLPFSNNLFTLFNIRNSRKLINSATTTKKTAKALTSYIDLKEIEAPSIFTAYNPATFKKFFEGKYYKLKYGEVPIIPFIPFEIQKKLKKITMVEKTIENAGKILNYGEVQDFSVPIVESKSNLYKSVFNLHEE